jgi:hypothetical protein
VRTKLLEVRDHLTCIPVLAVLMEPVPDPTRAEEHSWSPQLLMEVQFLHSVETRFLRHCGYRTGPTVLLTHLGGGRRAECDPYAWADRTWQAAHLHIQENFDQLDHGAVVDVRVLLGEAPAAAGAEVGR